MVASLLSSNVTVAFILGALFCAVPIFLGRLGDPMTATWRRQLESWSIPAQFQDFGTGVITLVGLVLLRRARGGDALLEHGAPGPAALGRRRGQLAATGSIRWFGSWRWFWRSSASP